jgi:putative phosphoesterase
MPESPDTAEHSVGIISDTHGLVRPEALAALAGVELILHAGDVGGRHVLDSLAEVAPVVAVRGNNDRGVWAEELPVWEVAQIGPLYVYMLHDLKEIDLSPAAAGFRVVVSGHSHQPSVEERGGVLYVNPGSAGPRRFTLPVTVARLSVGGESVSAEIVGLKV